jgi:hypothetical protein
MARNEDLRVALERELFLRALRQQSREPFGGGRQGCLEYLGSLAASRPGSPCSS